jgi:hypothetical protein
VICLVLPPTGTLARPCNAPRSVASGKDAIEFLRRSEDEAPHVAIE